MLKALPLFSTASLFAVVLLGPLSAAAQQPAPGGAKITPQLQAKAKDLYKFDCALCHNANGDGKTDLAKDMELNLTDWTDPKTLAGHTDQDLFDTIRKGKGKMPPEDANRAKDDEIWALIQYIRGFAANAPATPATPATPAAPTGTPQ